MSLGERLFEDPTATCFYIPGEEGDDSENQTVPFSPFSWRDLPAGYDIRMQLYKETWSTCLNHIQAIVRALYSPITEQVATKVSNAYTDVLPGLPDAELPIIAISSVGGSASLYTNILQCLHQVSPRLTDGYGRSYGSDSRKTYQCLLYPAECLNLVSMMKAIVVGFVDREDGFDNRSKRRPAVSLANYDIKMLEAWYNALDEPSNLVVLLHDFEQFDPVVVQDVFYICSLHVHHLPLIFLLDLSSPSNPSYLHTAYPRNILALLRIDMLSAPSEQMIVDEVVSKTFFDPNFEPGLAIGPGVLEFIHEFTTRHTASLDALTSILHIAYMKHFTEPLTILAESSLLGTKSLSSAYKTLELTESNHFLEALRRRMARSISEETDEAPAEYDTASLLGAVTEARDAFRQHARTLRLAVSVARIVCRVAREARAQTYGGFKKEAEASDLEFATDVLRGRAGRDVRYLGLVVKKLSGPQLRILLEELIAFYDALEDGSLRQGEKDARIRLQSVLEQLPGETDHAMNEDFRQAFPDQHISERDPAIKLHTEALGEWIVEYLEEHIVRLDEGVLWDVWYTGATPFPSELMNPAPRTTVVSALLHPTEFANAHTRTAHAHRQAAFGKMPDLLPSTGEKTAPSLWELPDTSILFRRYMEAGRMVNVYDWFQSFSTVLDTQRHLRRSRKSGIVAEEHRKGKQARQGSVSSGRMSKGKQRMGLQAEVDGDESGSEKGDVPEDEEEDDEWRTEVQARFMRALHELDWMGFVKHTGRKADHVIRTIYDVVDMIPS